MRSLASRSSRSTAFALIGEGGARIVDGGRLALVRVSTLLIVAVRTRWSSISTSGPWAQLKCDSRLAVVPGATHLFSEPGTLGQVTDLAGDGSRGGTSRR